MKWLLGRAGGVQERRQSDLKSCFEVEGNNLFSMNRINGLKVKEGEPLTIANEVRAVMNCLGGCGGWERRGSKVGHHQLRQDLDRAEPPREKAELCGF